MAVLNAVIGLSHYNQNLDFSQIKKAGEILGNPQSYAGYHACGPHKSLDGVFTRHRHR